MATEAPSTASTKTAGSEGTRGIPRGAARTATAEYTKVTPKASPGVTNAAGGDGRPNTAFLVPHPDDDLEGWERCTLGGWEINRCVVTCNPEEEIALSKPNDYDGANATWKGTKATEVTIDIPLGGPNASRVWSEVVTKLPSLRPSRKNVAVSIAAYACAIHGVQSVIIKQIIGPTRPKLPTGGYDASKEPTLTLRCVESRPPSQKAATTPAKKPAGGPGVAEPFQPIQTTPKPSATVGNVVKLQ